jgi:hypothetical protein
VGEDVDTNRSYLIENGLRPGLVMSLPESGLMNIRGTPTLIVADPGGIVVNATFFPCISMGPRDIFPLGFRWGHKALTDTERPCSRRSTPPRRDRRSHPMAMGKRGRAVFAAR